MEKHSGILLIAAGLSLVSTDIEKAAALKNQNRRKGNLCLRTRNGPAQNSGFFLFRRWADNFQIIKLVAFYAERSVSALVPAFDKNISQFLTANLFQTS